MKIVNINIGDTFGYCTVLEFDKVFNKVKLLNGVKFLT